MNLVTLARVPESQFVRRVRHQLAKDGERLIRNGGGHGVANVGEFFLVDRDGIMIDHDVDLVDLARKLNLLQPWERMLEE